MSLVVRRRGGMEAALCAALGALCAVAPQAGGQDAFRGWQQLGDPGWRFDPDRLQVKGRQVAGAAPVRDLIEEWESLRREGATLPAARKLQELIDDHGASALQLAEDRYVGAAEWARWLVRTASPEIRTAYSRLAAQVATPAFDRARADRDGHALRVVARRFANSAVGQEALLHLAGLLRERGARQLAAIHARRVLDFALAPLPGEEARSAAIAARAVVLAASCDGGAGLPAVAGEMAVGGLQPRPLADVVAAALPPPQPPADEWPTLGGDPTRTRAATPPERTLDLDRTFDLELENDHWAGLRSPLRDMVHSPIQPIRLGDRLYVNNTVSVRCFDLLTRTLVWEHEGQQVFAKGYSDDGFLSVSDFTPRSEHDDPTWSKALVAGLSAGQGLVIASLQVPLIHRSKSYQGFRINDPCPIRGLVALDAETGAQVWEQRPLVHDRLTDRFHRPETPRRGDPSAILPRLDVPTPPAIVDDLVFALGHHFEGAVNTYIAALDVRTGEPWYVVPLASGQQELSMFNMPFQEFTLGCPALADGTLFCATNVGLVTAVDVAFGDLRWVKEYTTLPIVEPRNYFRNNPRSVVWHNRGALAGDDLALFTPHDSRALFSLDPATGKERWSRSFTTGDSWGPTSQLIGVAGGRAFVAVAGKVLGLSLQGGRIEWAWPDDAPDGPSPRRREARLQATAALAGDTLWLPLDQEIVVLSLDGREVAAAAWPCDEPKNLLLFPDLLVASGITTARVAFDPESALTELRAKLAAGESLELLTRIGSLERQAGRLERAAATLARALELASMASPNERVRARAARCETLRELAERHRADGNEVGRERALVEALDLADDAQARVDLLLALLSEAARAPADERALRWLDAARREFVGARVQVPGLSPRPVALELWAAFELARRREARREWREAIAELERVQCDLPSESIAEGDSSAMAQERIAALLAAAPPQLRVERDREADAAFASAASAGDVERLASLLRRHPGAAAAPRYAAKEIELLRAARRPDDALRIGAELLRNRPAPELEAAATLELARSARELGNLSLARGLASRLGSAAVPDDLASLLAPAAAEAEVAGKLELVRTRDVPPNAALLGGFDRPLRGEPLPAGFCGALLLEQEADDYVVACLSLPSGEDRWRQQLRRARANNHSLLFLHVAGTLVVRRGTQLSAHDLATGNERWTVELDRDVAEIAAASGMLAVSLRTPPAHGAEEAEPAALRLIEPMTGMTVATVGAAGSDTRPGQLVATAGLAQLTSFGRRGQAVEVFDVVTARRRLEPKVAPISYTVPLLLPAQRLLVVPDTRMPPGEVATRQGVPRVVAWRLDDDDDDEAFAVDLLPLGYKLRATYPVAEGLALLGGMGNNAGVLVIDPVRGVPVRGLEPIPPDCADSWKRLPIAGDEGAVRLQGYIDWRKGGPVELQLLAGNGKALWRTGIEVPKNTVKLDVPDRIQRRGSSLLVAIQFHAGGKSSTDLVLLAEQDGRILAREAMAGGKPSHRDDVVKCGEWLATRQDETFRAYGWR